MILSAHRSNTPYSTAPEMSTSDTLLYPSEAISEETRARFPRGYTIRPLDRGDYKLGHLDVLRDLTYVGEISEDDWIQRFDAMKASNGTYYVTVVVDDAAKRLIGTATLVAEKKLYDAQVLDNRRLTIFLSFCELATQGHIEDVAVAKDYQGKKFGTYLMQALDQIGRDLGHYKVFMLRKIHHMVLTLHQNILNCSEGKDKFYRKIGYDEAGFEMENYFDEKAKSHDV